MTFVAFFRKYLFPAFYGMLIYVSIRLVNDVISGTKFWERWWVTNGIEIGMSVVMGYVFDGIVRYFVRRFSSSLSHELSSSQLLSEFATVCGCCWLVLQVTMIPMAALTDDGLQLYDVVNINLIPMLYNLLYYAIARGNTYLRYTYQQRMQLEKIRNDQLQTELKFLKAQYHPHFLFNALNTIYFQMDEDVEAAKKTLEKFSHLLRYQLYDQKRTVPVGQEIEYLQNFIDLQRVRANTRLQVDFCVDSTGQQQQIYPLLLLPLVENAFKYVGGSYRIRIGLAQQDGCLTLTVRNTLPPAPKPGRTGGLGLENLQRRLQLLYPDAHSLTLRKEGDEYAAELTIQLNVNGQ